MRLFIHFLAYFIIAIIAIPIAMITYIKCMNFFLPGTLLGKWFLAYMASVLSVIIVILFGLIFLFVYIVFLYPKLTTINFPGRIIISKSELREPVVLPEYLPAPEKIRLQIVNIIESGNKIHTDPRWISAKLMVQTAIDSKDQGLQPFRNLADLVKDNKDI